MFSAQAPSHELLLHVETLNLCVSFPCTVSFLWKIAETRYLSPQLCSLSPETREISLKFAFSHKLRSIFEEKTSTFAVILRAEQGTKVAGVVSLETAAFFTGNCEKIAKKLQKCPDSQANVGIRLEVCESFEEMRGIPLLSQISMEKSFDYFASFNENIERINENALKTNENTLKLDENTNKIKENTKKIKENTKNFNENTKNLNENTQNFKENEEKLEENKDICHVWQALAEKDAKICELSKEKQQFIEEKAQFLKEKQEFCEERARFLKENENLRNKNEFYHETLTNLRDNLEKTPILSKFRQFSAEILAKLSFFSTKLEKILDNSQKSLENSAKLRENTINSRTELNKLHNLLRTSNEILRAEVFRCETLETLKKERFLLEISEKKLEISASREKIEGFLTKIETLRETLRNSQ